MSALGRGVRQRSDTGSSTKVSTSFIRVRPCEEHPSRFWMGSRMRRTKGRSAELPGSNGRCWARTAHTRRAKMV
jgi:hypothetical protein